MSFGNHLEAVDMKHAKPREKRMGLRIRSDVFEKLEKQASELGLAPSTYAVMAIGAYVKNQEMKSGPQREIPLPKAH